MPHQRFHDLRHAYATLQMQAGTPIEQVSKALGHATLRTTVDVYGHLTTEMQHEAAARIDALLTPRREALSG